MDSSSEQLGGAEDEATCTSASEGLEEGEVEGETLLIVESEDQGSVDLSHDQSGDSLTSDVGEEADGGWACEDMSFYCDRCHKWVPAGETANHSSAAPSGVFPSRNVMTVNLRCVSACVLQLSSAVSSQAT